MQSVVFIAFALLTLFSVGTAVPQSGNATGTDFKLWSGFAVEQRQMAIAGFADCYRIASSNKDAFARTDLVATLRLVNEAANQKGDDQFGTIILRSIAKAPVAKSDSHAEHWDGPTGFHTGLWWRGIYDQDRQAYVQGVLWCAESSRTASIVAADKSTQQTVSKLNEWYVVSDEDWKDPQSNTRADVPVITALQRVGLLRISKPSPQSE